MKVVKDVNPKSVKINLNEIPKFEMDRLCRTIIRAVENHFKDPKNREAYEKWLKTRKQNTK